MKIYSMALASIVVVLPLVNARASDKKSLYHPPKKEFSALIEQLSRSGEEARLGEGLSSLIGMTGTPPVKGKDFTAKHLGGQKYRECSIVYREVLKENSNQLEKQPVLLYINKASDEGRAGTSYWLRLSLNGELEKSSLLLLKFDEKGNAIPGAGVTVEKDIASPEIQKVFKDEWKYWADWMKKEQKKAAAGKAKDSTPKKGKAESR